MVNMSDRKLDMGWQKGGRAKKNTVALVSYRKQLESRCWAVSAVSSCLGTC